MSRMRYRQENKTHEQMCVPDVKVPPIPYCSWNITPLSDLLGGGFKYVLFSPRSLGKWAYFFRLVQPPTSLHPPLLESPSFPPVPSVLSGPRRASLGPCTGKRWAGSGGIERRRGTMGRKRNTQPMSFFLIIVFGFWRLSHIWYIYFNILIS